MRADQDPLDRLATELADGRRVDWPAWLARYPDLRTSIRKMQRLSAMSTAFREQGESNAPRIDQGTELFRWGHLSIMRMLGAGSFGEVFRAYDPVLDRDIALKLRQPGQEGIVESRAFIHEARRMARVRHPNVLAVHGADIHEGRAGIWTDLLDGETLAERLKRDGRVALPEFYSLILPLVDAVVAIHAEGLVHGDIKSGNIMIEPDDGVVLMDFGAGGTVDELERGIGSSSGTPLIMAPELFRGASPSHASDVYALGVVMHRLLSGHYPVEADTFEALAEAHAQGRRESLGKVGGGVPRGLRTLIEACQSPDRELRPSATEVARGIRWLIQLPGRRARLIAIAAIIGALSLGLTAFGLGYYQARISEEAAIRSREQAVHVNAFVQEMLASASSLQQGREARVADVLDSARRNAKVRLEGEPESLAAIQHTLGTTYRSLGLMENALELLESSLKLRRTALGPDHPDTLSALVSVAHTLKESGRMGEARPLLVDAVSRSGRILGPDHPVTARATIRYAAILSEDGEGQESERLLLELLEQTNLSAEMRNLTYLQLSSLYLQLSRFSDAEAVGQRALDWYREHEGDSNFNTISTLNNLAVVYARQGNPARAEEVYRVLVELCERLMGEGSSMTVKVMLNLGNTLYDQGKYGDSLATFQAALPAARAMGPSGARSLSVAAMGIANAQKGLGNFEEAEAGYRQRLVDDAQALGALDSQTLIAQYNLAELLHETGRFAEAVEVAQRNLAAMRKKHGERHFFTLEATDNLAIALRGDGQVLESVDLLRDNLSRKRELMGADHPLTRKSQFQLIQSLKGQGAINEALDESRSLLEFRIRVLGSDHQDTLALQALIESLSDST